MTAVFQGSVPKSLLIMSVMGLALVTSGTRHRAEAQQRRAGNKSSTMIGPVTRAELQKPPFAGWFDSQYARYEPDASTATRLRGSLDGLSVEAFFGTWCGDSRRQIPRLLKVLDFAGFDDRRLSLIALSDQPGKFKQAPGNPEAKRRVHRTPTVVFVRGGVEVGRIVETPVTSIEKDLLSILLGEDVIPHYGAEAWVHGLFLDLPFDEVLKALLSGGQEVSKRGNPDSLWHYAEFDLLENGRAREAKAVLDLHLQLNPQSVMGLVISAEALILLGRNAEAAEFLDRALSIEPENRRAKKAKEKLRGQ